MKACYISPPNISLDHALHSRFMLAGHIYHVSSCPVSALKQLVSDAISTKKKGKKRDELAGLLSLLSEGIDELTRWYVIEEMLALKVTIPFVPSPVTTATTVSGDTEDTTSGIMKMMLAGYIETVS